MLMQADAPLAWYVENTLGRLNRNLKKHLRAPRDNWPLNSNWLYYDDIITTATSSWHHQCQTQAS